MKNDYQLIGSGLVHKIYKRGSLVFKVVKDELEELNTKNHFLLERYCHKFLRKHNFSVVKVYKIKKIIIKKNDMPRYALVEDFVSGNVYKEENISNENLIKILEFIKSLTNIKFDRYGKFEIKKRKMHKTWESYVDYCIQNYKKFTSLSKDKLNIVLSEIKSVSKHEGKGRFLIMDPNVENFVFDMEGNITAIDIDHPCIGDVNYLLAGIIFHKPKFAQALKTVFDEFDEEKIKYYMLLYAGEQIEFLHRNKIDYSIESKRLKFIESNI